LCGDRIKVEWRIAYVKNIDMKQRVIVRFGLLKKLRYYLERRFVTSSVCFRRVPDKYLICPAHTRTAPVVLRETRLHSRTFLNTLPKKTLLPLRNKTSRNSFSPEPTDTKGHQYYAAYNCLFRFFFLHFTKPDFLKRGLTSITKLPHR